MILVMVVVSYLFTEFTEINIFNWSQKTVGSMKRCFETTILKKYETSFLKCVLPKCVAHCYLAG